LTGRNPTESFSLNFRNRIISLEDSFWQDLNKLGIAISSKTRGRGMPFRILHVCAKQGEDKSLGFHDADSEAKYEEIGNFLPSFKNWCIPVVYPSVKYVTTLQCNYSGVPISEICNYTAALPAQLNDDVTFIMIFLKLHSKLQRKTEALLTLMHLEMLPNTRTLPPLLVLHIPFLSFRPSAPQEKYLHPLPTTALYVFADGNLSVIMVVAILGVSVS
ncbi:hypothetical protein DBR06_SOUSAS16610020, partial [Sousa chinensis]